MLPEYGGQKVKLGEDELFIFRDTDVIAKLEWSVYKCIYWYSLQCSIHMIDRFSKEDQNR